MKHGRPPPRAPQSPAPTAPAAAGDSTYRPPHRIFPDPPAIFLPDPDRPRPASEGIGAKLRAARQQQGLTWYAVAKAAGIPNPATVRDIEYGRDTKLSSIEAITKALGLKLELVELDT